MNDYVDNAEAYLQRLRRAYFPWSSEESTLACNVIRALIDKGDTDDNAG